MDTQKDPRLQPEELLKAENTYLKLKLGLEHGMQMAETSTLSPEVENQWLKSVYAFEQQFKDAKRIKLYDYIGRPPFEKWDTLTAEKTTVELKRLRSIMRENSVELDSICEYDDTVIYKFLTEELFDHEMDDMRLPGMTCHYTYEEFHPNHDYDLRKEARDLIRCIFEKEWHPDYDVIALSTKVVFMGNIYEREAMSSIITAFQEAHASFKLLGFETADVLLDTGDALVPAARADAIALVGAKVTGHLTVAAKMKQGADVLYDGGCIFHFERDGDYWYIKEFTIPGITREG